MKSKNPSGEAWQKARARNIRKQIEIIRKKIKFWQLMGAEDNEQAARREMISLKSKLADAKKAR